MTRARILVMVLLALVLAPVPLVVTTTPAHACSCNPNLTSDDIWEGADVVIVGDITGRQGDPEGYEELSYEVLVTAVYKGTVTEVLTFSAYADSAACGWTAEIGDTDTLLVLHETDDGLSTHNCTMMAITPVPDDYVGTEHPPDAGGTGLPAAASWTPLWLGLGLGVLVLAGLWLVLRRPLRGGR